MSNFGLQNDLGAKNLINREGNNKLLILLFTTPHRLFKRFSSSYTFIPIKVPSFL